MLKLSGKHILLLLLYSPGKTSEFNEPIEGRTRIIKMMFLFHEEIKDDFLKGTNIELVSFPEFFAWKYGPFSKDIYDDIEFFINNGFIFSNSLTTEMTKSEFDEYGSWIEDFLFDDEKSLLLNIPNEESFTLTPKGTSFIKKYFSDLTEAQKNILIKFKSEINQGTLEAILRYTYVKHPKYTNKSNIKERILG